VNISEIWNSKKKTKKKRYVGFLNVVPSFFVGPFLETPVLQAPVIIIVSKNKSNDLE
jgi:hypothetical protein